MSSVKGANESGEEQLAPGSSHEDVKCIEQDRSTTLKALNRQNGYRFHWYDQPPKLPLPSDPKPSTALSTRNSNASKSTWSNVSSYFGGRTSSIATSPPTSTDYANTFGTLSYTAPSRIPSGPAPAISRFSTSSTEFNNPLEQPYILGDVSDTVQEKNGIFDFVQEKFKSGPLRKLFNPRWGKQAKVVESEVDVEAELKAVRQALLGTAEDRLAMAIIASKDSNQHILFEDPSSQHPTLSEPPHEEPQYEPLDAQLSSEGSDLLGDPLSQESYWPRRSKHRSSYQSIQSSSSHDSASAGRLDIYQRMINIYLPGSKGKRWVSALARFDCQSDDSHISPLKLQELGIEVSTDLAASRPLQRLGIIPPHALVSQTTYSATGSAGETVSAQGEIKLTWKADMAEGYHTNRFYIGPESAPYDILIGGDFLVPSTGPPRMKLCLPNYRNTKSKDEIKEAKYAKKKHEGDVAENEIDKKIYAASQRFNSGPLAVSSMPHQTNFLPQSNSRLQQNLPQNPQTHYGFQQHFPSPPIQHQPIHLQPQFSPQTLSAPSSQVRSPQQPYSPLPNPLWTQQQSKFPQQHLSGPPEHSPPSRYSPAPHVPPRHPASQYCAHPR